MRTSRRLRATSSFQSSDSGSLEKEASLRGAAVLTLERLGERPRDAPVGRVVEPRPEHADAYRAARERQKELYDAVT